MKTAIIYISRHGTTEKVSQKIAEKFPNEEVDIINLQKQKLERITDYKRVILGGSVHMGKVHKKTTSFIEKHHQELLQKQLGLFLCCMEKDQKAQEQFDLAFPEDLRKRALSKGLLGFEYLLEKMSFIERLMVKKITGKDSSFSKIDEGAIRSFVDGIKHHQFQS